MPKVFTFLPLTSPMSHADTLHGALWNRYISFSFFCSTISRISLKSATSPSTDNKISKYSAVWLELGVGVGRGAWEELPERQLRLPAIHTISEFDTAPAFEPLIHSVAPDFGFNHLSEISSFMGSEAVEILETATMSFWKCVRQSDALFAFCLMLNLIPRLIDYSINLH